MLIKKRSSEYTVGTILHRLILFLFFIFNQRWSPLRCILYLDIQSREMNKLCDYLIDVSCNARELVRAEDHPWLISVRPADEKVESYAKPSPKKQL